MTQIHSEVTEPTMLEKMALAMFNRRRLDAGLPPVDRLPEEAMEALACLADARAGLEAIRAADASTVQAATSYLATEGGAKNRGTSRTWTSQFTAMSTRKAFAAVIDTILKTRHGEKGGEGDGSGER